MKKIRRKDARKLTLMEQDQANSAESEQSDEGELMDVDESDLDEDAHSMATGSFVKVEKKDNETEALPEDDSEDEPDFYDVNVLTWDSKASPLHTAIINGHIDICKALCQTFGADYLLPVKILNDHDNSPRAAILTLVLALTLPLDQAKAMAKTLLELGATCAQADLKGLTAFHYYVNDSAEAMLSLLENDKAAALSALNHVAVSGSQYNPSTSTPFTTAIRNRDSISALKLLEAGANNIDFAVWIKAARTALENKWTKMNDPEQNNKLFKKSVDQPIILAVEMELPEIVLELLEKGADPNTLTKLSHEIVAEEYQRRYNKGESLLDLVTSKLEELRSFKDEKDIGSPPEPLEADKEYLDGLEVDGYKYWVAATDLARAKKAYKKSLKEHRKALKDSSKTVPGSDEKQRAIKEMILAFEKVKEELDLKGARTFKELHPDIEEPSDRDNYRYKPSKPTPFEVKWNFAVGELTDSLKEQYLELFQAAWIGDIEKIKSLTLVPQGPERNQLPLKIAVLDSVHTSPFSLAVMRGHLECATAILQIAQVQFVPLTKDEAKKHYSIGNREIDSDYDSDDYDSDDSDPLADNVISTVVDDTSRYTIDNIAEVSLQVKSDVKPLRLIQWHCPVSRFIEGNALSSKFADEKCLKTDLPTTLLSYAITREDLKLLTYLIERGAEYSSGKNDSSEESASFFEFPESDFNYAIKHGKTHHLAEILKRTGAGIPFEDLVKKSGVELTEKPKFYQGLNVKVSRLVIISTPSYNILLILSGLLNCISN